MLKKAALAILFAAFILPVFLISVTHAEEVKVRASLDYLLGPDDVLSITVYREDELNRDIRVSADGKITFPLIGEVKVEDLTVAELEKTLEAKLKKYLTKPQVTVFINSYATITVTGQVKDPGSFPLKSGLTALEAIGLAKGFTKIAGQNDVKIMRMENGEKKTIKVKLGDISRKGDKSEDVLLKRGDIVFVPESLF